MKAIHNPQLQTQEWLLSYIASQIYPKFANILYKKQSDAIYCKYTYAVQIDSISIF